MRYSKFGRRNPLDHWTGYGNGYLFCDGTPYGISRQRGGISERDRASRAWGMALV
jgi:hypothetical protein